MAVTMTGAVVMTMVVVAVRVAMADVGVQDHQVQDVH